MRELDNLWCELDDPFNSRAKCIWLNEHGVELYARKMNVWDRAVLEISRYSKEDDETAAAQKENEENKRASDTIGSMIPTAMGLAKTGTATDTQVQQAAVKDLGPIAIEFNYLVAALEVCHVCEYSMYTGRAYCVYGSRVLCIRVTRTVYTGHTYCVYGSRVLCIRVTRTVYTGHTYHVLCIQAI